MDHFIEQLRNFHLTPCPQPVAPMGFTENMSATFLSSGNPCLDFFFHVVPDTLPGTLHELLKLSWDDDSLTTLKLVGNLRGVRGTGKSDKENFYTAALWMHQYHPKTLACNLRTFAEFGYFKDLLEILYRLLEGPEIRENKKMEWRNKKKEKARARRHYFLEKMKKKDEDPANVEKKKMLRARVPREERVEANIKKVKEEREKARKLRKLKVFNMAKKASDKYDQDANYRFLHDQISALFAQLLKSDMEFLNSGEIKKISLAAKCAQEWESIPYNRVASVAMRNYTDIFLHRDNKRFREYLENVKAGKAKITAGALLPHEIIGKLKGSSGAAIVAELQWKRMVDELLKNEKLTNCLAICDVSGSMFGTPMEVAVALGLLVSELCEEPWKGHVITFSAFPELHLIREGNLRSKTEFIRQMDAGMNTDFQKVFDKILESAVNKNLPEEKMIKRVFVFSDMEFDKASENPWDTDYMVIQRKFQEKGYKNVPEIVFWNLRDSSATPVTATQNGVALVSGFSKNLLTLFLEEGGIIKPEDVRNLAGEDVKAEASTGEMNPEAVMEAAISGELYQKLAALMLHLYLTLRPCLALA
ncbi:hypothetical protein Fot_22915 [Forsythia ovata]|uniref:Uncharacterized protein n=1 Tax=Forsythia ovata TaxID=205694 RepID=A0ABD1UZ38_9LAMI